MDNIIPFLINFFKRLLQKTAKAYIQGRLDVLYAMKRVKIGCAKAQGIIKDG